MLSQAPGLITIVAQLAAGGPAAAQSGRATVIDGDTLEVAGVRVRLWGIDAPESRQTCLRAEPPYPCGQRAA